MELEDDIISVFTYDDSDSEGAIPEPFNLTALTSVANRLFSPKKCALEKIAEGGFHKVCSDFSYFMAVALHYLSDSIFIRYITSGQQTGRNLELLLVLPAPIFQKTSSNLR